MARSISVTSRCKRSVFRFGAYACVEAWMRPARPSAESDSFSVTCVYAILAVSMRSGVGNNSNIARCKPAV